jgi:hypothetical protein
MINIFPMEIIIAVIAGVILIVVIALAWLVRTHLKLKYDYQVLAEFVHVHNNDITDLCTAVQTVDGYMAATDKQLSDLCAKISDYQSNNQSNDKPNESSNHPYNQVIQKVRGGASVNELMQNSGLSQDEAALLIRLHGSKQ